MADNENDGWSKSKRTKNNKANYNYIRMYISVWCDAVRCGRDVVDGWSVREVCVECLKCVECV